MSNPTLKRGPSVAPISLRLTQEERAQLEHEAGSLSLSAYIRSRLFGAQPKPDLPLAPEMRLSPGERQKLLAQLLARLGGLRIGPSLAELAHAARIGALPLTPEVLAELRAACAEVRLIRTTLLRALGLKPGEETRS